MVRVAAVCMCVCVAVAPDDILVVKGASLIRNT